MDTVVTAVTKCVENLEAKCKHSLSANYIDEEYMQPIKEFVSLNGRLIYLMAVEEANRIVASIAGGQEKVISSALASIRRELQRCIKLQGELL
jgi:hypothetical protein